MDAFLDLAERQHGLGAAWQAAEAGLTRAAVRHLVRTGDFEPCGPRVLRRTGSARTEAQRVLAAVLDAGPSAVLSHGSAAAWWGLPGFDLRALHVTRPRSTAATAGRFATVHRVKDLVPEHVTVLDGVPIVRPERCFIEVCATTRRERAARMLDNAWSRRLLSGDSTRQVVDELAQSGRNGIAMARELLDERGEGYVPPATGLEGRAAGILADAGLGRWRRQVDTGGERWSGRVDFRHDFLPVVLEVQSERYHASLCDRVADAARRARLEADGFVVVEVWDNDVWHHPDVVTDQVLAAISAVRATGNAARTGFGFAARQAS